MIRKILPLLFLTVIFCNCSKQDGPLPVNNVSVRIDPNGGSLPSAGEAGAGVDNNDTGGAMDPNGRGWGIDPNGRNNGIHLTDQGSGIDPNGKK